MGQARGLLLGFFFQSATTKQVQNRAPVVFATATAVAATSYDLAATISITEASTGI